MKGTCVCIFMSSCITGFQSRDPFQHLLPQSLVTSTAGCEIHVINTGLNVAVKAALIKMQHDKLNLKIPLEVFFVTGNQF